MIKISFKIFLLFAFFYTGKNKNKKKNKKPKPVIVEKEENEARKLLEQGEEAYYRNLENEKNEISKNNSDRENLRKGESIQNKPNNNDRSIVQSENQKDITNKPKDVINVIEKDSLKLKDLLDSDKMKDFDLDSLIRLVKTYIENPNKYTKINENDGNYCKGISTFNVEKSLDFLKNYHEIISVIQDLTNKKKITTEEIYKLIVSDLIHNKLKIKDTKEVKNFERELHENIENTDLKVNFQLANNASFFPEIEEMKKRYVCSLLILGSLKYYAERSKTTKLMTGIIYQILGQRLNLEIEK